MWDWPAYSSRLRGRMRAARGCRVKVSGAAALLSGGGDPTALENRSSRAMPQITIGPALPKKKNHPKSKS
jgi:hypothetical protein